MKAITVREPGGPEQLELVDLPNPEPGPGGLLVHVRCNRGPDTVALRVVLEHVSSTF
ncbi:MAG: hypothetical protein ACRDYX_19215 [Egibacteraceae bacterium]